ncbi:MAG TPA: hypothetical protein VJ464_06955 [Blastocatellia bacterium]|nr:hypothetical protein [Blastocatellia bacterium]
MADPRSFADLVRSWSTQHPVVLLPARVETRFDVISKILRIRIYPDDICADTHEPLLTEAEAQAGAAYWKALWKSSKVEDEQAAWRMLVKRFGAQRAAWVVLETQPANLAKRPDGEPEIPRLPTRPQSWTRGAQAQVLPSRWIAIAYRPGGRPPVSAEGNPVVRPLALTLSPADKPRTTISDDLMIAKEILWTVDYGAALEAGMAMNMPLDDRDLAEGFERLIVIGAAGVAPEAAQSLVEQLFEAHHYSRGIEFLRQGTPTNNTQAVASGFPPPDPDANVSFAVEQRGLTVSNHDGERFVRALGLRPKIVEHVAGADRDEYRAASAMSGALWPVTFGNFIRQLMAPAFDNQEFEIESARGYFIEHVKARGPYPALRVGAVPYGLLPVTSLRRYVSSQYAFSQFERELPQALNHLLPVWLNGAERAPRVGQTGDPDADLLAILGMEASTQEVRVRSALGPSFILKLYEFIPGGWPNLYRQLAEAAKIYERLGKDPRTDAKWMRARANWFSYLAVADRFGGPLVTSKPLSETDRLDPNYITWIRQATIEDLRKQNFGAEQPPDALLYLLLRHATLLEYVRLAYDFLIANRKAADYERYEREFSNLFDMPAWNDIWKYLGTNYAALTNNLSLGEYLLSDSAAPQLKDAVRNYHAHLEALEELPTAELERLFSETLDVCSHRVDAWVTSLAKKRIAEMRRITPDGCHLAAFGWVEKLRPAPAGGLSGGYIHSPSMNHAAAAAILRNAYLTRGGASRTEYAIDLSSSRVRTARWLLDSVRNGQPLGAVLGYLFERRLHEIKKEIYIAPLRKLYPLVADKASVSGEPVEAIAARNVVDGLLLRKAWRANTLPYERDGLPAKDDKPFQAELQRLDDAVDAVADLLTAESVYQMVRGNTSAGAATLDAMAQGLRPPDPEIVRTPRSGLSLTHRVLLIIGATPVSLSSKWRQTLTPRAGAEPCLDAWVGSVIGDPEQVRCRVSVLDPTPTDPQYRREVLVTLADLNLRPLDVLALARTSAASAEDSELDRRVAAAALAGSAPSDVQIIYEAAPDWSRTTLRTFPEVLELAGAINSVIAGARPLKPEDLTAPEKGTGGATNGADAARRANAAADSLRHLRAQLNGALTAPRVSLREPLTAASLFGVQGAFPSPVTLSREALAASATSALAEIDRRLKKAGPDAIKADDANAVRLATDMLQAVFGEDFVWLPQISAPSPDELANAMANSPHTDPKPKALAVEEWFQQTAPVRAPLARWRKFRLYAEALGVPYKNPDLAQLPFREKDIGARWIGASLPESSFAGKISLVLYRPAKPDAGDRWAGLLIDEWTEVIPLREQATAAAFHYDNPGAEAPQTVLLAAPPVWDNPTRFWDADTLIDIINETFDLVRARAVDGELLDTLAALRPPILLADSSVDPELAPTVATTFAGKLISDPVIG